MWIVGSSHFERKESCCDFEAFYGIFGQGKVEG